MILLKGRINYVAIIKIVKSDQVEKGLCPEKIDISMLKGFFY